MSNFLGLPFDSWVKKQIEIRQKVLGKIDPTSKDIQYYTSKTPFLRVASSVNLTNKGAGGKKIENTVLQKLVKAGIPEDQISGDKLAKNFILQGGAVSIDNNNNFSGLNSGLNDGSSLFNGAYGWGGSTERGYVPLPGIQNCDVTYYNNGALSKTTLDIVCYSKTQFQLLDVLYLRPGYSLLVEFGWSQYLSNPDSEGNYTLESFNDFLTEPMSKVLNGGSDQYEVYGAIEKEREKHYGNYEAIYGKITKFNWQFQPDGSYSCQVELTAIGDVIESLKCNITSTSSDTVDQAADKEKKKPEESDDPPLIGNATATVLNEKLFNLYNTVKKVTGSSDKKQIGTLDYKMKSFKGADGKKSEVTFKKGILYKTGVITKEGWWSDTPSDLNPQIFMKYGMLLAFIQSYLMLYNPKKKVPLAVFDFNLKDLDKDKNVILTIPGQMSVDPRICLMPNSAFNLKSPDGKEISFTETAQNTTLKTSGFNYNNEVYLAKIAHLYVNVNYVASVLATLPPDQEGKIVLLDFLKAINGGLIQATGGINKYEFKLSQSGLKLQLIEDIPQRFSSPPGRSFTRFNVYGVKPGIEGSFIRNVDLTADLSNNFATMISIGAQSNANQISENATSFSSYNAGLQDRIIEAKVTPPSNSTSNEDTTEEEEDPLKKLYDIIEGQKETFKSINAQSNWNGEDIESFRENMTTAISLALGELTDNTKEKQAQLQAPFFLPFNFSLEMDGLSGMKLYEKFLMTDDILPPSYEKDGVDLQINGINHSISKDAWITKVDTLSVPRNSLSNVSRPPQMPSAPPSNQGSTGNLKPPPPQTPPEDEKLRLRLTRLMDDGTQTLGYFEVLAEDESTVLYRLATSELPWLGNQNSVSCIPVDKYRVKSHSSSKYGNCFWVIGNEGGGYAFNKLFGNGFIRTAVLIHMAPKAPGWLMGCIAPGLKFNEANQQKGRQKGTGQFYLDPAKSQSSQALAKLADTLYSVGSYRMEIVNNGGVSSENLPKTFAEVKSTMTSLGLLPNPR
jgi:hypothetical protein